MATADAIGASAETQRGSIEAMRAYLQRGETRLSTMQRIAGAFLSGAGLLILLPFLLSSALGDILATALSDWQNLTLLLPYVASVGLPIFALYKLVEDLIKFYFSPVQQGDQADTELSKFALTGLAFPPDESLIVKNRVLELQRTDSSIIAFALGELGRDSKPLRDVYSQAGIELIDPIRQPLMDAAPGERALSAQSRFHVAMAVTGSRDRTLVEEVARMEASLMRHALILRRLVLRYGKALLVTIWTTIITMIVVALVDRASEPSLLGHGAVRIALGMYVIWGLLAPYFVIRPQRWTRGTETRVTIRDPSLLNFENWAKAVGWSTAGITAVLLIVDIAFF